ncbi:MAG: preprotein translocase subunit SecE [Clostridia bacterium]|nr:preprotein translocase subunit SecE [Clostridia bacterium]
MGKKSPKVELGTLNNDQLDTAPAQKKDQQKGRKAAGSKSGANKATGRKTGAAIKKFFRDLVSELKKVSWGKMRSTKNNKGVLSQTGIVLQFVLIAIVILTAMDLGLTALLNLLIGIAG